MYLLSKLSSQTIPNSFHHLNTVVHKVNFRDLYAEAVKKRDEKQTVKNESGLSQSKESKKKVLKSLKLKNKRSLNDNNRKKTCSRTAAFWVNELNRLLVVLRS